MEALVKRRGRAKANMSRMETYLSGLQEDNINVYELDIRDNLVEKYFKEFNDIQDAIEDNLDESNSQYSLQMAERDTAENKYIFLKTTIREFKALSLRDVSSSTQSPSTPMSGQSLAARSSSVKVKLPNMNIPVFEGNYGAWRTFFDLFTASVGNNPDLSKAQKFVYLKSFLKGEPLCLISELNITDNNYETALDLLKDKYDKQLPVINHHINSILDLNVNKGSHGLREFLCHSRQHISALESLNVKVHQNWDLILVNIFAKKIDKRLRNEFEIGRDQDVLPTIFEFFKFLEKRVCAWEMSEDNVKSVEPKPSSRFNKGISAFHLSDASEFSEFQDEENGPVVAQFSSERFNCFYCKGLNHSLNFCHKFKVLPIKQKREFVMQNSLCFNCLSKGHVVSSCMKQNCRVCSGKHNVLLHDYRNKGPNSYIRGKRGDLEVSQNVPEQRTDQAGSSVDPQQQIATCTLSHPEVESETSCLTAINKYSVLLSTAIVKVISGSGTVYKARALLDSGSQSSFITYELVKRLKLKRENVHMSIAGISECQTFISEYASFKIQSAYDQNTYEVNCGIMDKITCSLPQRFIDTSKWNIPPNIHLADNKFNIPGNIDLLIGADLYFDLILSGVIELGSDLPKLINTKLGWILGGFDKTDKTNLACNSAVTLLSRNEINYLIPKFWQLEEISLNRILSNEDKRCEQIFSSTMKRNEEGRFVVNLPLKTEIANLNLGNSFELCKRRFLALERRLSKDNNLRERYCNFINEYVELGHAKYVSVENWGHGNERNFIPHHAVLREESITTKLRVVFDNSMKTSSGVSLNDVMFKGPIVQSDLFDIICRFRMHKFVLMTDIKKMFRQVLVSPEHRVLQSILWRENPDQELKCLELQTVTYGTNCAPFLATRCLIQLAEEGASTHPLVSQALFEQCYVDDILAGSDSLDGLQRLRSELSQLLKKGKFELHKWISNVPGFIDNEESDVVLPVNDDLSKVLGVKWLSKSDRFVVCDSPIVPNYQLTKRNILAHIARLFDPLGFIGPVIVTAKYIMQRIWASKIDWDDTVSDEIGKVWIDFASDLSSLKDIKIPRLLFTPKHILSFELHGFSDASEKAYGTCFYLRAIYLDRQVSCRLITSKSRIAPLKTQTLPRLELCGALLMARMYHKLCSVFHFKFSKVILWSDSKITLSWIKGDSNRWTTFVAHRVAEIQELTTNAVWSYVSTENNPADCISRGLAPSQLLSFSQWWNGPLFLYDSNLIVPLDSICISEVLPEQKENIVVTAATKSSSYAIDLFPKFSSYYRLIRTLAFCFRFINGNNNCRKSRPKWSGTLSVHELEHSQENILLCLQAHYFQKEIQILESKSEITKGFLFPLSPFIDKNGLIRVNSRLSHSDLPFSQRFPVILPPRDHVVSLIIKQEHLNLFHAGPQLVLSNLRLRFWPIAGISHIKKVIKECLTCHRLKSKVAQQIMAPLPKDRTSIARPFLKVGVDYGGPIITKESRLRKSINYKSYIALFVCMTTKAIHLELVTSLSTEAFLSTLKRFIARRGCPEIIYSDNGTNFQGACSELSNFKRFFEKENGSINNFLSLKGVVWKFIPPNSPHWGGLWEAGIKSTKFHLKRISGGSVLNFEQLMTILCQIEAILNSRPLSALSSDPSDLSCLTPGHFLVGEPLTSYPERDLSAVPDNRLKMWDMCQKIKLLFWKRWSCEYLNQLQHRPKWLRQSRNINVNELVLLKEDNLPPLEWRLARVIETFPGRDNKIRVVRVRTKDNTLIRPISKLCPLPFSSLAGGEDVAAAPLA